MDRNSSRSVHRSPSVRADRCLQGVKYLVDMLNLKEIAAFLMEDLDASWKFILIGLGLATLLSVGQ